MYAWGALKPADIVSAACALRDLLRGEKANDEVQDTRPADAAPADNVPAGGSAAAE